MDDGDTSADSSSSSHRVFNNTNTPNSLTATISRGHFHQCGTARRVKVYELQGEIWFDRGTGYCAGVYDEAFDEALLVARMENNCVKLKIESEGDEAGRSEAVAAATAAAAATTAATGSTDGQSAITDGEDKDYFVLVVSENLETEDMLLNTRVVREDVYQRQQAARGKVAEWLFKDEYVKKLIPVFHDAEELEQLEDLHRLCSIMQTILMLNDNVLVESILQDDVFLDVMGMLEYDPEFPRLKASYRDYLVNQTRFRQVVPIHDPTILAKIHQTFRLLYLKDVILTRIVDDSTFAILNSLIFYHQADIINFCSSSEQFLTSLFGIFGDPPPASQNDSSGEVQVFDDEKKGEAVIFIQQLVSMGKQIQLPTRIALYRVLTEWGLLVVLEYALSREDGRLKNAATEVLLTIIEYDATAVRVHILEQVDRSRMSLLSKLVDLLHEETDLGLKTQLTEALRILFDSAPDGTSVGPGVAQSLSAAAAAAAAAHGDTDGDMVQKEDSDLFLAWFYEEEVEHLFEPLKQLPRMKDLMSSVSSGQRRERGDLSLEPRAKSALIGHLCDLLTYIVIHHSYRSQYWIVSSDISARVGALLSAREKHIRLSALRFFRACLTRTNQFINRHLIKLNVFEAILYLMETEESKATSWQENVRAVIGHLHDKFKVRLEALAARTTCGSFFSALLDQARRNKEAPVSQDSSAASAARSNAAAMSMKDEAERKRRIRDLERRGQNRAMMDLDEEHYFGEEDDEDEGEKATSTSASTSTSSSSQSSSSSSSTTASAGPKRGGLVPYSDEDGEEEAQEVASSLPALHLTSVTPSSQEAGAPGNFLATPPTSSMPAAHVQPMISSSALEEVVVPKLSGGRRKRDASEGQDEEDDDDDMMGRLAKRKSSRKSGGGLEPAAKAPKQEAAAGGFIKEDDADEKQAKGPAALAAADDMEKAGGGKKKLPISLSSSSQKMIKSDDEASSSPPSNTSSSS
ncbi:hypothetical protein L7F22_023917 [Adiantum nelumboides]|nr:hypothetical protein [Adiantum nelumboides]